MRRQNTPRKTARKLGRTWNKVPGFGGVEFGAALPAKGFEVEQDRGALKIYKKSGERLLMGPAPAGNGALLRLRWENSTGSRSTRTTAGFPWH